MAIAYVIKSTYLEGPHAGKSHILLKEGYVANEKTVAVFDNTYATIGAARATRTRYQKRNEQEVRIQRRSQEYRKSIGKEPGADIWTPEKFEVVPVEIGGYISA